MTEILVRTCPKARRTQKAGRWRFDQIFVFLRQRPAKWHKHRAARRVQAVGGKTYYLAVLFSSNKLKLFASAPAAPEEPLS
jgi:hypothetical protein